MTTQKRTVTTRAKEDLVYVHEYDTSGKKPKTLTLRLLASPKGIVRWLAPDPDTGRVSRPDADNFDDFLELVVHPDDGAILADAIAKGQMADDARYDAAVTAWKNSMGETDYLSIAARLADLRAQAEALEVLVEQEEEVPTEDDSNPLDD